MSKIYLKAILIKISSYMVSPRHHEISDKNSFILLHKHRIMLCYNRLGPDVGWLFLLVLTFDMVEKSCYKLLIKNVFG